MRVVKTVLAFAVVALITGCAASGPKYTELAASIPPVAPNKGRVFFYRADSFVGSALGGDIKLNGRVVGQSKRGSWFFADEKPGSCIAAVDDKRVAFELAPGETKFVQTTVQVGAFVGSVVPVLVYPEQGKSDLTDLAYIGEPIAATTAKK